MTPNRRHESTLLPNTRVHLWDVEGDLSVLKEAVVVPEQMYRITWPQMAEFTRQQVQWALGGHLDLYTGSSDAEGTLGGLVMAGRDISRHMRRALECGELCSNDPVCAHHVPTRHDGQQLLGSACHGCLLIAETSCEQRNEFLDRALLVPTVDTPATLQTLIENAETEILLVGYTVHNGKRLFKRLAERMEAAPALRVAFCLDIARKPTDTSLASEIVRRFAREFVTKHWPGKRQPEVFYDPRALAETWEERASLHAKCVMVDRRIAIITSANFTEAAQRKNIEAGVLIRYEPFVTRLNAYFEALRNSGQLLQCPFL